MGGNMLRKIASQALGKHPNRSPIFRLAHSKSKICHLGVGFWVLDVWIWDFAILTTAKRVGGFGGVREIYALHAECHVAKQTLRVPLFGLPRQLATMGTDWVG